MIKYPTGVVFTSLHRDSYFLQFMNKFKVCFQFSWATNNPALSIKHHSERFCQRKTICSIVSYGKLQKWICNMNLPFQWPHIMIVFLLLTYRKYNLLSYFPLFHKNESIELRIIKKYQTSKKHITGLIKYAVLLWQKTPNYLTILILISSVWKVRLVYGWFQFPGLGCRNFVIGFILIHS